MNEIEKLGNGWGDLDCGQKGYYDDLEDDLTDIKISEKNMTAIVSKINEIIENVNEINNKRK